MAFPYSSGDVLTAADLNASFGMVFIKSVSISSGAAFVQVNGAFSGTFDNYRIVINNINNSTGNQGLTFTWPGITTGWYGNRTQMIDSSTSLTVGTHQNNIPIVGVVQTSNQSGLTMDVLSPAIAIRSVIMGSYYGNYNGTFSYQHNVSTAYTAFSIAPQAGTFTGGTIRVYGYNNG